MSFKTDMQLPQAETIQGSTPFQYLVRPNQSLSKKGFRWLFAFIVLVSLTIGLGFSLAGAWMILPFAGLEILLAGAVLWRIGKNLEDYEQYQIDRDSLTITRSIAGRIDRHMFQCYWAKLLFQPPSGSRSSKLRVRSHGTELEIARHLNDQQKSELAAELGQYMGKAYSHK